MQIAWGAHTHAGSRPRNDDGLLADGPARIFAVADGSVGALAPRERLPAEAHHPAGGLASRIAVESLRAYFAGRRRARDRHEPPERVVRRALAGANAAVHRFRRGPLRSIGSTLAALWLDADVAVVAHLGDSRVYRLRDGALARLTRDHSLAELFRERGADEAAARRVEHLLTRSLGQSPDSLRPDLRTEALAPGDVYLVCSDGLTDALDDGAIASILRGAAPEHAAVALVDAALAAGAADNVTAVVVAVT